jgi:hypothetical protein
MVKVHRLVERFDQGGIKGCAITDIQSEAKINEEERKFIIDCEQDLRGIVKKVVKVKHINYSR